MWKVNWWKWDHERGTKQKSPRGIELMTSRTPGGRSIQWGTRTHGEQDWVIGWVIIIFDRRLVYCLVQHCRSIRTFLCPTLVSCSSIHLSHRCCCCWQCTRIWHFEPANLNSVISISPLFRTQNDFAWISSFVIYYWLFRTPALSNNFFVSPKSKK